MGDISTWNPVDNSNTTAPPDGWPEGMAPSGVNNSARAMMGAVRRWYDTVTAQISSLTTADNLRVLKAGDTMTGALSAPQYNINGVRFASSNGTTLSISDAAGGSGIDLQANINYFNADSDVFLNNAGGVIFQLNSVGNGVFTGNVNAWDITAGGTATAQVLQASNTVAAPTMTATGTIQGAQLTSTGNINAAGTVTGTSFIGNVSVPANGPVSTGGTVTGGQVTSTGNASVAGTMTAGSVSASSDVTAAGSVTGGSMHCQGTMQTDGQSNLLGPVFIGPGGAWARIDSSGSYNVTGSWQIISGRAAKENIVDYDARGLAEVLALRPVAFNYRADLFGPEEAAKVRYGLVADEVAPVLPEMVGEAVFGGRHLSTLSMGHLNVVLVRACQDLAAQNAALAARITVLEGNHV